MGKGVNNTQEKLMRAKCTRRNQANNQSGEKTQEVAYNKTGNTEEDLYKIKSGDTRKNKQGHMKYSKLRTITGAPVNNNKHTIKQKKKNLWISRHLL